MIEIYALENCWYSKEAVAELAKNKIEYKKISVPNDEDEKAKIKKKTKMKTFPQIFIVKGSKKIKLGGYSELNLAINLCKQIHETQLPINVLSGVYENLYKKKK